MRIAILGDQKRICGERQGRSRKEEGQDVRDDEDDGGNTLCEGLVGGCEKDYE